MFYVYRSMRLYNIRCICVMFTVRIFETSMVSLVHLQTIPVGVRTDQFVSSGGTVAFAPSIPERSHSQGRLPEDEHSTSGPISDDVSISLCQLIENTEAKPFVGYVVNVSDNYSIKEQTVSNFFSFFLHCSLFLPPSFLPLLSLRPLMRSSTCPPGKRQVLCRL